MDLWEQRRPTADQLIVLLEDLARRASVGKHTDLILLDS